MTPPNDRGLYGKTAAYALEQLVLKHLPGSLPGRVSVIDPVPAAREIVRAHYDALVAAAPLGETAFFAALKALGVAATGAVLKATFQDYLRERMHRSTSVGVPPKFFAG